eukprot:TRINITY_DN995_c0_g2_i3.p1 TRINITY_DN995_c0_g2~~TRINITY_DN995_c0_g2_i3.p1  ORF type:complete len:713 (-),score=137.71 TRINITY_DN995_c0_g2_i3:49-1878(-)
MLAAALAAALATVPAAVALEATTPSITPATATPVATPSTTLRQSEKDDWVLVTNDGTHFPAEASTPGGQSLLESTTAAVGGLMEMATKWAEYVRLATGAEPPPPDDTEMDTPWVSQRGYRNTTFPSFRSNSVPWTNVYIPTTCYEAHHKLMFLIRRGVPNALRFEVWLSVSGCFESHSLGAYTSAFSNTFGKSVPRTVHVFPMFGGSLQEQCHYLTVEGVEAAKRILCMIGTENPDVEYCPMIPDILLLLLTYMDEAEAYALLSTLLARSKQDHYYFNLNRAQAAQFYLTFNDLVKTKLSNVYRHMQEVGVTSMEEFASSWFKTFFVGFLPYKTALRVMDVFMNEGIKVLYRVGLAILYLLWPYLKTTVDPASWSEAIIAGGVSLLDGEKLIKTAFSFRLRDSERMQLEMANYGKKSAALATSASDLPDATMVYYRPKIETSSTIIQDDEFELIWSFLPNNYAIMDPVRLYTSEREGFSLATLIHKCEDITPTIIFIRTPAKHVFGAFISVPWTDIVANKGRFVGDGYCFLWSLHPQVSKYGWQPTNEDKYFVIFRDHSVAFGLHAHGAGLMLDDELNGHSYPSPTYNSPALAEAPEFPCTCVEVWTCQ